MRADRAIKRGTLKNALRLSLSHCKGTGTSTLLSFSHRFLPFVRLFTSQLPFSSPSSRRLDRQARREIAHLRSRTSRKCSNYGNYNAPSYTDGLYKLFFFEERNISERDWWKALKSSREELFLNSIPIEIIYRFNQT